MIDAMFEAGPEILISGIINSGGGEAPGRLNHKTATGTELKIIRADRIESRRNNNISVKCKDCLKLNILNSGRLGRKSASLDQTALRVLCDFLEIVLSREVEQDNLFDVNIL